MLQQWGDLTLQLPWQPGSPPASIYTLSLKFFVSTGDPRKRKHAARVLTAASLHIRKAHVGDTVWIVCYDNRDLLHTESGFLSYFCHLENRLVKNTELMLVSGGVCVEGGGGQSSLAVGEYITSGAAIYSSRAAFVTAQQTE